MIENEEVKGVEDTAITYEYVKGILGDLDKMPLYLGQERLPQASNGSEEDGGK